jgi:GNAT superfamily N-acetyltransferase
VNDGFPELETLQPADAAAAAHLFVQLAPQYFLSRFGEPFLANVFWRPFYRGGADFGFVWKKDDRVVGLAAGTTAREGLLRRIVTGAPLAFAAGALRTAVLSPRIVGEGIDLVRRLGAEGKAPGPDAELITLGILPREVQPATSPVTGRQVSPAVVLLHAAAARMRAAGANEFRLYTGAQNHLACRLYRNLGFTEARRFTLFGEERICFVRSTAFDDPL